MNSNFKYPEISDLRETFAFQNLNEVVYIILKDVVLQVLRVTEEEFYSRLMVNSGWRMIVILSAAISESHFRQHRARKLFAQLEYIVEIKPEHI